MAASGGSGGDRQGNDRTRGSLQGLLKFCTEQTQDDNMRTDRETISPLTDERRAFLEDVFRSLQEHDPVKVMLANIKVILEDGVTDEDKLSKEGALEQLQIHVEDLDLANDFYKIGGYTLFQPLLQSEEAGYRWRVAELIATVAQNNPESQQALLDANILPLLRNVLQDDPDNMCQVKALYAISCFCRDFPPAQEEFLLRQDGFSVLVCAMQHDLEKIKTKATFMLAALCTETPRYKEMVINLGLLDQLVGLLHGPHSGYHEHLMRALLVLCDGNEKAQSECRRQELGLCELLLQRQKLLHGQDEYQEELDYCQRLHEICFRQRGSDLDR